MHSWRVCERTFVSACRCCLRSDAPAQLGSLRTTGPSTWHFNLVLHGEKRLRLCFKRSPRSSLRPYLLSRVKIMDITENGCRRHPLIGVWRGCFTQVQHLQTPAVPVLVTVNFPFLFPPQQQLSWFSSPTVLGERRASHPTGVCPRPRPCEQACVPNLSPNHAGLTSIMAPDVNVTSLSNNEIEEELDLSSGLWWGI